MWFYSKCSPQQQVSERTGKWWSSVNNSSRHISWVATAGIEWRLLTWGGGEGDRTKNEKVSTAVMSHVHQRLWASQWTGAEPTDWVCVCVRGRSPRCQQWTKLGLLFKGHRSKVSESGVQMLWYFTRGTQNTEEFTFTSTKCFYSSSC